MSDDTLPPGPEPANAHEPYWNATKDETLVIPYCNECEEHFFFPRSHCPTCMTDDVDHVEAAGTGELVSYSTVLRPPVPQFQELAPYINGIVKLDEGVQLFTNIEAEDESELEIGMPVEVTFVESDSEYNLPYFKPV